MGHRGYPGCLLWSLSVPLATAADPLSYCSDNLIIVLRKHVSGKMGLLPREK